MAIRKMGHENKPRPGFSTYFGRLFLLAPLLTFLFCFSCKPAAEEALSEAKYLSSEKQWNKKLLAQLENAEAELTTSWSAGKLHYILDVSPYGGNFNRYIKDTLADNKLVIHLEDMGGLNLLTIEIPLKSMTSVTNSRGEPAALEMEGDVRLTKQMYKAATDWSLSWSFPLKH